ncbi:MAG: Maf family protein [Kiritimatiellaeota bacterium]|nr:Maf family protein [Kiritimatiellota bacterium]
MTLPFPLILGSASPRRKKIMDALGYPFTVVVPDAQEIHDPADPVRTVVANAASKYRACRADHPAAAIITADTLVWFDGRLIGKPSGLDEAARFLRAFSGRTQIVYTGIALGLPARRDPDIRVEASSVTFRTLSEEAIQAYLRKTNPIDRAGAYDIDESGDLLVAAYSGSRTNIMGLPRGAVRDWIASWRGEHPHGMLLKGHEKKHKAESPGEYPISNREYPMSK